MTWICVVDDVADVRDELAEALRQRGYDVRAFPDGMEALHAIDSAPDVPGLVLLDILLPYMTGLEVLERLRARARTAAVPVLLMTGFELEETRVPAAEAAGVLRKPLALDHLLASIEQMVGAPP
jgi:DNA-binding response OmpR family regulator